MKRQYFYHVVSLLPGLSVAAPIGDSDTTLVCRKVDSVDTTINADGSIIDWIRLESQVKDGKIASAPPLPVDVASAGNQTTLTPNPLAGVEGLPIGPEGTVPILRKTSTAPIAKSQPVDPEHMPDFGTEAVGDHWYASTAQGVANNGGSASYSLYKAWTESNNDFSLLQAAVIRYNVPKPGDNSQTVSQTVEAGWINYPAQVAAPHLFTYFTTDGYSSNADNKGGWNRDVKGWVQTDSQIFPGTSFAPLSTRGGAQYEIKIQWLLYQGNWWLYVLDRWIGYYPASLFGANTDASKSLQTAASQINYYGEIYDSHPQLTKTDMGSGDWPESGWQESAYIRNMVYTDTSGNDQTYDGSRGVIVSDTNRYRLVASWASNTNWGSYMYLGGPGAGGAIGS